jgi:hypothetical protein
MRVSDVRFKVPERVILLANGVGVGKAAIVAALKKRWAAKRAAAKKAAKA